jgi:hypothetical protein
MSIKDLLGNIMQPSDEKITNPAVPIAAGTAIRMSKRLSVPVLIKSMSCSKPL